MNMKERITELEAKLATATSRLENLLEERKDYAEHERYQSKQLQKAQADNTILKTKLARAMGYIDALRDIEEKDRPHEPPHDPYQPAPTRGPNLDDNL